MKSLKLAFKLILFLIIWPMAGYKIFMLAINKYFDIKGHKKEYQIKKVSLIITAHNEQKVIKQKLDNIQELDYPSDMLEVIVSSDNSNDDTDKIVSDYINSENKFNVILYKVKERKGKTNAQNEAVKIANGEILVFTDANSMLDSNAINELVASFCADDIMYVTGDLNYINAEISDISDSESTYWNLDKSIRNIESKLSSVTAGNGALYAIRKDLYIDIDPIHSHDSKMPREAVKRGYRAIANKDAKAYEKAGEIAGDEYKRKVRMNRVIVEHIAETIDFINIFKYKWFTFQYISHRTLRYLLAVNHLLLYIVNLIIIRKENNFIFKLLFMLQTLFYICALIGRFVSFKPLKMCFYYVITLIAQLHGFYNFITGKRKPVWEKAESTR